MCGIAGILSLSPERAPVAQDLLARMTRKIAHRGPDGEGLWLDPQRRIGLGHRRLSIVDLDVSASQPMLNHRGDLALVFNGEIYNHAALRQEIQAQSPRPWKTDHSDTEVILHGFDLWGIDVIQRLRGMFAFALWDERARELWLVRDRLGKKPLYFAKVGQQFAFASEIKALLEIPGLTPEIEPDALGPYLTFLTTPSPLTMFKGIYKLAASEWLRLSAGGETRRTFYWDPQAARSGSAPHSFDDSAERLLAILEESVAIRTVSDRPIGVFLSGGVDSGVNLALFRRHHEDTVHSFTVGYQDTFPGYTDEFEHAATLSRLIGATQHSYKITQEDIVGSAASLIYHLDEPVADPTCIPTLFVSRIAREHGVVVCQAGEGSDELFGGYSHWLRTLKLQSVLDWTPQAVATLIAVMLARVPSMRGSLLPDRIARHGRGRPSFWGGSEAFTPRLRDSLLTPSDDGQSIDEKIWPTVESIRRRYREAGHRENGLNWMTFCEARIRLPDFLLMRVDKSSMAVGVEARAPFLDHTLFEYLLTLPQAAKLPSGKISKELLKHAARQLVPAEVLTRPKQGFGITPLYSWLMADNRRDAEATIRRFASDTALINLTGLDRLLANPTGIQLWALYTLAIWYETFVVRRLPGTPIQDLRPLVSR